jgi:cation:H+ antiporter
MEYLQYILFVIGFGLLIKGADILVSGASSIAKSYNISDMVVGLTVVSFGTSMPELIVNILASMNGNTDIAIGNVFGSNIANILLILGVSAIIYPISVQKETVLSEVPFSIIAVTLVGFLANSVLFSSETTELVLLQETQKAKNLTGVPIVQAFLGRIDGIILLLFFVLFMVYIFWLAKQGGNDSEGAEDESDRMPMWKAILFVVGGIIALFVGGKFVVDGAVKIAQAFNMSEAFIGLTVVAVGTSLPELVTSAMAAYRKNSDIAVGNVVGSNIFNIFWILGLSATISPLPFNAGSNFDAFMIIVSTLLIILLLPIGQHKGKLDRVNGFMFLGVYIAYTYYLLINS